MKNQPLAVLGVGLVLVAFAGGAFAGDPTASHQTAVERAWQAAPESDGFRGTRLETLWIFDADFETETGDNAGWTTFDRSGTLASPNYWHHDTIRVGGFAYLGDSTWWCGTYNECWRQDRGYANDWLQILEREFPEVAANTTAGDPLALDWDQRFAMEHDYDYGYVEISDDGGSTWTTLYTANNPGFAGKPGLSQDWDSSAGHVALDLSVYAGLDVDLRFRFESDGAYSSQDQYNNGPPNNSVQDGAWQLDNITWSGPGGDFWVDDCESGNMGWVHDDVAATGQVGLTFWRGRFGIDFVTGRDFTCDDRDVGSWMYAAVDPFTSTMVHDEDVWLVSPPIDISGAPKLVGQWDMWVDLPQPTGDRFDLSLASNDAFVCVTDPAGFLDESPGGWYGGPFWGTWTDDWDAFAGNDWLAIRWEQSNEDTATVPHMGGIFLNRQRVGVPSGDAGTTFSRDTWNSFNDWFQDNLADALLDSARIRVKDDDGIATLMLLASNDEGMTWSSYNCHREDPQSEWWITPPPSTEMLPGSIIRYYYECTDEVGTVSVYPSAAPDSWFEMSILPITATTVNRGILLVDKHGRRTPSEQRDYLHTSEYYYREALQNLGYTYEKYDVEVPSGTNEQSDGPDTVGMKYYHTQVWFVNEFDAFTIKKVDQFNLIQWLQEAGGGGDRNLILSGNDIGKELMQTGRETLSFYETWLASDYVENAVGAVTVDSVPGIVEAPGGSDFIGGGEGIVRGACPTLNYFDVVQPFAGIPGAELALEYIKADGTHRPAGVAYTHQTLGYHTINYPFGIEFIMDGTWDGGSSNYTPEGYYQTGIQHRVNVMDEAMDAYFSLTPGGDGTGVVDGGYKNVLAQAFPNPFNPVTKISYSIREAGRTTITVYNVAGRSVRVLLDEELDAGSSGNVVWDGRSDSGDRCASGVYFYRIEAPGFASSKKMVMMK